MASDSGWTLFATTDGGAGATPAWPALPANLPPTETLAGYVLLSVLVMLLVGGVWRIAPRVWRVVEDGLFANWRLSLLAATGLVLSLASGWTTWDGMRNFTNEPVLSLMITFGIQGVMLIIAWLIGESFATGMSQRASGRAQSAVGRGGQALIGGVLGVGLFVVAATYLQGVTGLRQAPITLSETGAISLGLSSDQIMIVVVGLMLAGLVALYSASDIVRPYLQSSRVILKNAVLWVMFLACMATSVFFSFDSLFSAIFPQSERVRAAELRAQNQVAGIVADIGTTISSGQMRGGDELFRSEGWREYEAHLEKLTVATRGAEGLIEAYYVEQMEARRSAIAEQSERIATAEGGKAGLTIKKATLTEELSRLEAERPALVADFQARKSELDGRAREVDAKRVEAMAEDKGVEGTGKVGRGPVYRERMAELSKLQDYYKIGEQRVKDAEKRVEDVNKRIDGIRRELAEIDGSLAKLDGEAQTAQSRIAAAQATASGEAELPKIDPARVLPAFEAARVDFRERPEAERLASLQEQCSQLLTAMTSTPATKDRVQGIDCDPKRALEAAAPLFALNQGAKLFTQSCVGGDKLNQNNSADALFGFARRCLADSGLPSQETDLLRQRINYIELNRDDKAHRFVVTWNAFQDGNRLAYLALAIAIAIDGLIFMSGLFGANAVRSPLSDVPSLKSRSAQQLESIVENALLPDTFETARMTLQAMRPITNVDGYMAEVRLSRLDPHAAERVSAVLTAGATIHAVAYEPADDRYLVRAELFEFLSTVSKKAFAAHADNAEIAELEKIVAVALLPDVGGNAELVLSHIHPISERHGFTGEVKLTEVTEPAQRRTVRNMLNAGAVLQRVQRAEQSMDHYFVHRDLYKTLARLRARSLYSGTYGGISGGSGGPALAAPQNTEPVFGGALGEASPQHRLTDARPRPNDGAGSASGAGGNSVATLTPARDDNAASSIERSAIRQRLVMALGFAPSDYRELVQNGSMLVAGSAARELTRLCRQVPEIGAHLEMEIGDLQAELDRSAEILKLEHGSPQLVDEVHDEIVDILPALLLIQGGKYQAILNEVIANLEEQDGSGALSPRERHLKDRLKRHESELSRLPRSIPGDWRRVAVLLQTFGDGWAQAGREADGGAQDPRHG
ncbi:MAG: hypothetical protein NW216_12315 [Hyphomicrobium sp.]|nr:hypothetical protein [Hyphomicrobium sp.]